ncbi:hypothetical protein KK062_09285 [Fulvivirgaceae bacterium PWU5]|uniref:Uncharacterized protein n=1 Tax=Dawidia cretensis TaxID=2782350 RepID=A0AAP2GPA3_9BACT|nr:hypothetical protein [Dawidia cretensis]MBT1708416.1 hypothetical protein [Dawidia cretensis]
MLQNRVDPLGRIIKTSARGSWMGNRGVIHNEHKEIIREFKHIAWITCVLEFKGRERTVMTAGRWTELFFLDEATAFAAGHRPCFECRREDAKRFKSCWIQGNHLYNFSMSTSIKEIDAIIHRERITHEEEKAMHQRLPSAIPEGTFTLMNEDPYLFSKGKLHRWTPFGYEDSIAVPEASLLTILTPDSIVNAFRAGYAPQIKGGEFGDSP